MRKEGGREREREGRTERFYHHHDAGVVVGCVGCTLCSRAFAAAKLAVMATVSSFGPGQNLMLMRNEMSRSGSLVAMLSSCNPHVGLQGVCVCACACLLAQHGFILQL